MPAKKKNEKDYTGVKQPYDAFLVLDVEGTCESGTDFNWPNEIIVCIVYIYHVGWVSRRDLSFFRNGLFACCDGKIGMLPERHNYLKSLLNFVAS